MMTSVFTFPLLGKQKSQKVVQTYVFLGQKSIESSRNYVHISGHFFANRGLAFLIYMIRSFLSRTAMFSIGTNYDPNP